MMQKNSLFWFIVDLFLVEPAIHSLCREDMRSVPKECAVASPRKFLIILNDSQCIGQYHKPAYVILAKTVLDAQRDGW